MDRTIIAAHGARMTLFAGVTQLARRVEKLAARCMIVAEVLKEEVAGERGPWRACQPAHDEIFWSSRRVCSADGTTVYGLLRLSEWSYTAIQVHLDLG